MFYWHHPRSLSLTGSCVAIGNFDGMHLGHQALLKQLKVRAQALQLPAVVILFEPQPQEYFSQTNSPARLMRLREKLEFLRAFEIDHVYCLHFTSSLANVPANDFIDQILLTQLKVKHLLVGEDFRFGYQRQGDVALLQARGKQAGFEVSVAATVVIDNQRISSTSIRQNLQAGLLSAVVAQLGRPYSMTGRVIYGLGLGQPELNCPTANIALLRKTSPLWGIYAVHAQIKQSLHPGVASVGYRPVIGRQQMILEVHLLDFSDALYGTFLRVFFQHKIRDEENFSSFAALQIQIAEDIIAARQYHEQNPPSEDLLHWVKQLR